MAGTRSLSGAAGALPSATSRPPSRLRSLIAGGPAGNEQLTAMTGALLLVLLAILGVTIIRIGQLIWLHLFLGVLLLGPLAIKLGSTGYRFVRYYTAQPLYRSKGPPPLLLRLIAPGVIVTSLVVFASGLVLLLDGPAVRDRWLLIHKASFIVWLAFVGVHVLGHLPQLPRSLRVARSEQIGPPGSAGELGRWIVLAGAVVGGLVLAVVLLGDFGAWTAPGVLHHHHHGG